MATEYCKSCSLPYYASSMILGSGVCPACEERGALRGAPTVRRTTRRGGGFRGFIRRLFEPIHERLKLRKW